MEYSYRTKHNAKAVAALWGRPIEGKAPYEVKAASNDQTEIFVTDVLGWPFNDINAMVRDLSSIKTKDILVRLNSPGGDPIDTFSLYHAFKNHPANVVFRIEALAASAASFLALAGNEVQAYSSSLMMIHLSSVVAIGNRYDLSEISAILEKIDSNMQDIYTAKTKIGKKEMAQMMADETWMTAKEAQDKGFIDTILESGKTVKAQFDLSIFNHIPDGISAEREGKELSEREIERALRDAGGSRSFAKSIVAERFHGQRDADLKMEMEILTRTIQNRR